MKNLEDLLASLRNQESNTALRKARAERMSNEEKETDRGER